MKIIEVQTVRAEEYAEFLAVAPENRRRASPVWAKHVSALSRSRLTCTSRWRPACSAPTP